MMYSEYQGLLFGFHGCRKDVYNAVIKKSQLLEPSNNAYDWLGSGIYFWENSYARALDWARNRYMDDAAVIGAVINLGYCLNLTDYQNADYIKDGYSALKTEMDHKGIPLPKNKNIGHSDDWLLRDLDCAVINYVHAMNNEMGSRPFDSVRGIFTEGNPIYPGAGFRARSHVQLCIRSNTCIKGYFAPLDADGKAIKY